MHKKFEINRKKIKGGCQSGGKVVPHDFKSYLTLVTYFESKCSTKFSSECMPHQAVDEKIE